MATHISHSPAETEALGEAWGRAARSGLVIGLTGDLGAGKTQFVKGLARGLGISARIQSPTFALVNIYTEGRLPLYHLDLYRLESREQVAGAGLEEYLQPDGVAVIEWAERMFEVASRKSQVPSPEKEVHSLQFTVRRTEEGVPSSKSQVPSREEEVQSPRPGIRLVRIETLGESERRITYEDIGD